MKYCEEPFDDTIHQTKQSLTRQTIYFGAHLYAQQSIFPGAE